MPETCLACGHVNDEGRFCSSCGASLDHGEPLDTGIFPVTEDPDTGPITLRDSERAHLPAGSALLVVKRGPLEGVRYPLDSSSAVPITIGRAPDSDIFLDDVTVSRRHAKLTYSPLGWTLVDVGSLNGSYVNRARVDSSALVDQDEVQVGKYRFVFLATKAQ
jgi:pSer/pThr/pTyr-binding forkhead associated (FHA) protein